MCAVPLRRTWQLCCGAKAAFAPAIVMSRTSVWMTAGRTHVDCMTETRQYAAAQQKQPLETGTMAIGEFGGAPAAAGDTGPMYAAPAYWLYEMSQAALNPLRAFADAGRLFYRNPANPLSYTAFGKTMAATHGADRALDPALRQARMEHHLDRRGRRARPRAYLRALGAAVLPAPAFRARVRARAAPPAAAPAHRRADVGALPDAAARHRRGLLAQSRRLHHRMGRRADGAGVGGPLRSRRLHRLLDLDAAFPRRRRAHPGGVSAFGPGAGRGRPHGGRERPLCSAFHGADGRPDRYPGEPDGGEHACGKARHRLVPPQRHHQGAVSESGASCATSIRASCSCTASSA